MRKPTVTTLMLLQEIESLKRRIAELEARPPVVIHNHPPADHRIYGPSPFMPPAWPQPFPGWKVGDVYCGISVATDTLSSNGGGSSCLTAHGGGSSC